MLLDIHGGGGESQPASRLFVWQQLKFVFVDVQPIICPADADAVGYNQSRVRSVCDSKNSEHCNTVHWLSQRDVFSWRILALAFYLRFDAYTMVTTTVANFSEI